MMDKDRLFSIGDVSEMFHISVSSLRLGQTHGYDGIFLMLDSEDIYDDEKSYCPNPCAQGFAFAEATLRHPSSMINYCAI